MGKSQSKTIHIGNAGEHYLASQLSKYCIVRDVGQGKDTGIDLYCEIVHQASLKLSLHFFCQVKTQKKQINVAEINDKYWSYWGEQPVPVFLFLIKYDKQNQIQESNEIWVCDIPYILSKLDAKESGQKVPRRDVEEKFKICDQSNNKDKMTWSDFIYHHIPWSYGLWHMRRFGLILPNPAIENQQNNILVGGFSYLYKKKTREAMKYADMLMKWENTHDNN
jgi:hypothetical protein